MLRKGRKRSRNEWKREARSGKDSRETGRDVETAEKGTDESEESVVGSRGKEGENVEKSRDGVAAVRIRR